MIHPTRTSRRGFLKIGSLGVGGLSLSELLRDEAKAGIRSSTKSVIFIYLVGGPPHQDMFDLKPNAPAEIRGPWKPIPTNVPGIEICEAFPLMAKMMDKFTIIRSLVGNQIDHDAVQVFNGRDPLKPKPGGNWPQFGSVIAKLQGHVEPAVPGFISLCYPCTHPPYNEPGAGFLGTSFSPYRPIDPGRKELGVREITVDRLADRKTLMKTLENARRFADTHSSMQSMDTFNSQAFSLLTSSKVADALDLSKEDPRTVARYGTGNPKVFIDENGAPRVPQSLLMARRLIEAGVRVVTLNYSKWDWHGGANNSIFQREKEDFPALDQCLSALVEDLHARGLAEHCSVVVMGEFGRTPKINGQVGRDHWPQVNLAIMAGGGMKSGQVIGATDRIAGEAISRPVTFGESLVEQNASPISELV